MLSKSNTEKTPPGSNFCISRKIHHHADSVKKSYPLNPPFCSKSDQHYLPVCKAAAQSTRACWPTAFHLLWCSDLQTVLSSLAFSHLSPPCRECITVKALQDFQNPLLEVTEIVLSAKLQGQCRTVDFNLITIPIYYLLETLVKLRLYRNIVLL